MRGSCHLKGSKGLKQGMRGSCHLKRSKGLKQGMRGSCHLKRSKGGEAPVAKVVAHIAGNGEDGEEEEVEIVGERHEELRCGHLVGASVIDVEIPGAVEVGSRLSILGSGHVRRWGIVGGGVALRFGSS